MRIALALLLLAPLASAGERRQPPSEDVKILMQELKQSPDNKDVLERLVAAGAREPVPAVPKEADRAFLKGLTLEKEAKGTRGRELAIKSYGEALEAAPWWLEPRMRLAFTLEEAGRIAEAHENLRLYLIGNPKDRAAERRLYALEAKLELAQAASASESSVEGVWATPAEKGGWIRIAQVKGEWVVSPLKPGTPLTDVKVASGHVEFRTDEEREDWSNRFRLDLSPDGKRLEGRAYMGAFKKETPVVLTRVGK